MNRGCLIFAHNSRDVDYAMMAIISGGLAKKNLQVPVSLVTDQSTIDWMKESGSFSKAESIFENFILVDRPVISNRRKLSDGQTNKVVPFINDNRASAWDLTPYDHTLLIDCDYLIFSDNLNKYWDLKESFLISKAMNDIRGDRIGYLDKHISETGVHLFWATTVMFIKNEESKQVFELVKTIRDNYEQYSDIYRFNSRQYRNDISFSIAKHLLDGFTTDAVTSLPPVLSVIDRDLLVDINGENLLFLVMDASKSDNYNLCSIKGTDIHIMNKQSIVRNKEKLLELV